MYYLDQRGSIYECDLPSGNERFLVSGPPMVNAVQTPPDGRLGPISLSPDGHWIASYRSVP